MEILADSLAIHRQPDETIKGSSLEVFLFSVRAYYSEELLFYKPLLETTKIYGIFKMIKKKHNKKKYLGIFYSDGSTAMLNCT